MTTALRDNIDWVGYVDWNVRDFHGYETLRGATYNSYLIRDQKNTLIDTVKAPYAGNLIANIRKFIDPADINYLVCNHVEMDHSGAMPRVLEACSNAVVLCNERCRKTLSLHFDTSNWKFQVIKDGEILSIGRRTLQFINTPMIHWPESMFTYVPEEKLLFSMDAFGQHYATSQRFDDENPKETALGEAKIYYASIVMPFSKQVRGLLESVKDLPIDMIATSHGVIWRSYVGDIIKAYHEWSHFRAKPKVLILYDTMYSSTNLMADAIYEGAIRPDVEVKLHHVRTVGLARLAGELLDSAVVAVGTPTVNKTMMPMVASLLAYFKGLEPENKAGFSFGSYGWSRGGAEAVDGFLKDMKFEILRGPLICQYRPDEAVLEQCREAGKMISEKALEMSAIPRAEISSEP